MRTNIRLGRIAGIPVGLSWGLVAVAALFTWQFATVRFPLDYPGSSPVAYWLAGAGAAVLFFASVLAHELGHALVARRNDVPVEGITLWFLGGVAKLGREARTAGAAFRIAAAGPLVSILAGGFFIGAGLGIGAIGAPALIGSVLVWLGLINFVLAAFNLIPAAPLDGGRILSAAVWARTGSAARGRLIASRSGTGFGWLLVAFGLFRFSSGETFGLWTVFIGWFLLSAARVERQAALESAEPTTSSPSPSGALVETTAVPVMTVGDVMAPTAAATGADTTVAEFLADLDPSVHHDTFPVRAEDGSVRGLVDSGRLRQLPSEIRDRVSMGQLAEPLSGIGAVRAATPLIEAAGSLPEAWRRSIPVVDSAGRLVGTLGPFELRRLG